MHDESGLKRQHLLDVLKMKARHLSEHLETKMFDSDQEELYLDDPYINDLVFEIGDLHKQLLP